MPRPCTRKADVHLTSGDLDRLLRGVVEAVLSIVLAVVAHKRKALAATRVKVFWYPHVANFAPLGKLVTQLVLCNVIWQLSNAHREELAGVNASLARA